MPVAELESNSMCRRCGWLVRYGCACEDPQVVAVSQQAAARRKDSVVEKIARAFEPDAWADLDSGTGTYDGEEWRRCEESLRIAERLVLAYPVIIAAIS